ncbi:MAG: hypothetical protein HFJ87_03120 [Muribaculaceae bacterium]|nr:hypothetical protein [Muribaculaceae bacterium]MCI9054122.1 hypothetical protein [Muribaculaceae bacterium]
MVDFNNTLNDYHFSLDHSDFETLQSVFSRFHEKTGLYIDEYGDIKLIPQNLELIVKLALDYTMTADKQSTETIMEFVKNLRPMMIDGNTIIVSGD